MKNAIISAAVVVAAMATSPAFAQSQIVNISSVDPSAPNYQPTPVTYTFGPGTYSISAIGQAQGGAYNAYSFASPPANNFQDGFQYTVNGQTTTVNPFPNTRFPDAASALAAYAALGVLSTFTLTSTSQVTFSIPDTFYFDNLGGTSLGVTKGTPASVPEPGTLALFGLGAGALLAMRRRKQAAV